jgi:arsenite oxidase small subunit
MAANHDDDRSPPGSRVTRRDFIRIGSATAAGTWVPQLAAAAPAATYPVIPIAELRALKVDTPMPFSYPDADSPAVLLRLRQAATGGVGPDRAVVAFSMLCTHKGCPVAYRPERKLLICPCHWSSFDPAKGGQMVIGQASQSLPQVTLRLQGETVQAVGIEGLVYGRHTNIL